MCDVALWLIWWLVPENIGMGSPTFTSYNNSLSVWALWPSGTVSSCHLISCVPPIQSLPLHMASWNPNPFPKTLIQSGSFKKTRITTMWTHKKYTWALPIHDLIYQQQFCGLWCVHEIPSWWGWTPLAVEVWLTETGWGSNHTLTSRDEDINLEEDTKYLEGSEETKRSGDSEREVSDDDPASNITHSDQESNSDLILILTMCPVRIMKRLWIVSMDPAASRLPYPK